MSNWTLAMFEAEASLFRIATGMLAPGKDYPLAQHPPDPEERRKAWTEWFAKRAYSDAIRHIAEIESKLESKTTEAEEAELRIANLRAAMSTVAARLHDNDEPRQVLASALEMALMDDDKAANR